MVPRHNGQRVATFAEADEVVCTIRGSKTDQLNRGEVRNHFRTSNPEFCVVEACAEVERHNPRAFKEEGELPICRWPDGSPVLRSDIAAVLVQAAKEEGVDAKDIGTHSLRFGGASALYAAFKDTGLVQRWGRWASQAFHGYIWEARDAAQGVAEQMRVAQLTVI